MLPKYTVIWLYHWLQSCLVAMFVIMLIVFYNGVHHQDHHQSMKNKKNFSFNKNSLQLLPQSNPIKKILDQLGSSGPRTKRSPVQASDPLSNPIFLASLLNSKLLLNIMQYAVSYNFQNQTPTTIFLRS